MISCNRKRGFKFSFQFNSKHTEKHETNSKHQWLNDKNNGGMLKRIFIFHFEFLSLFFVSNFPPEADLPLAWRISRFGFHSSSVSSGFGFLSTALLLLLQIPVLKEYC